MQLDVFISGENIDLCVPTREFAEKSDWYSWFNDPKITRYLQQGIFPNNPSMQVDFFEKQHKERLLLIISNKKEYLGVVSLSSIDFFKKSAQVALVVDSAVDVLKAPLISLEAIARITEHGFQIMGLNKISGAQHINLSAGWGRRMELLGFRVEGINRQACVKGHDIADGVWLAMVYDDYLTIKGNRGKYWDSAEKMEERIRKLPEKGFTDSLRTFMQKEGESYYQNTYNL
ncbi:MAG: hypothetical protein A3E82_00685 [Gammaproteobacteria bacterium RIFCSPHIGHO2_12_FULL_38_11]|nr:MAG: hypothetical protein A3E82_00685 [Gammaproteobacteria bacterium RIFCSPHIGHO2_12_FULL_38_11]